MRPGTGNRPPRRSIGGWARSILPSAARIHENDRQRIERALEIHDATGTTLTAWLDRPAPTRPVSMRLVGLRRDRAALYARINQRVVQMIESGLEEEVRRLLERGYGDEDPRDVDIRIR